MLIVFDVGNTETTIGLFEGHGAGAAVAFGTALLGAGQPRWAAQPVKQRGGGDGIGRQPEELAVEGKIDRAGQNHR